MQLTSSLTRLPQVLSKVTPEQAEILKAKYSGLSFERMTADQLQTSASAIIAAIKILTGWNIPTGQSLDLLRGYLASELRKEYPTLTVKEIELAFRGHAGKVIEYGKDLNLSLFNKVMNLYFEERNEATTAESSEILRLEQDKVLSQLEEIKNVSRAAVQESYEDYLSGKFNPIDSLTSASLYDCIISDSLADPEITNTYIGNGIRGYKSHLIAEKERLRKLDAGKSESRKDDMSYKIQMNDVDMELSILERIISHAKRWALKFCFDYMKENGKGFYQREVQ